MPATPSAHQEREYEKRHVSKLRSRYLSTDVVNRAEVDRGYAAKIELIERFLGNPKHCGHVLDLGSNTAGEAEVLAHRGYSVVATDVNELALSISRVRSTRYRSRIPLYFGADATRLPFADATFDRIVAFEVLHHLEEPRRALSEVARLLRPAGRFFALEPYAYNPYRRIAELRFYRQGGIEKSFSTSALRSLVRDAGLDVTATERIVLPPSAWKQEHASRLRARLMDLYHAVSSRAVRVFGDVLIEARRPSSDASVVRHEEIDIGDRLICPITRVPLRREGDAYVAEAEGSRYRYTVVEGVPVLLAEEAEVERM